MKLTDIINTRPLSSIRGGAKGHIAEIVGAEYISTIRKTAEEAQRSLVDAVAQHFRDGYTRRYFFSPSGKTCFALYHQFGGWCYDIIRSDMAQPSTCGFNSDYTLEKAAELVVRHAAEYAEADEVKKVEVEQ